MSRLIFTLLLALPTLASSAADKPNVILIMADDMGWGDVAYNGNKWIKTPHLDQMSKEGIKFNRWYAQSPVCSPTRASCLLGRHPYRTGVFGANTGILRPEEVTIAEMLKKEGYTTGHFGKWHLGTLTIKEKDANRGGPKNPELFNPPHLHGFDVNFSTESKVPTWDPMKKPKGMGGKVWDFIKKGEKAIPYGTYYWNEKDEKVTENLDGDDSRVIMDRAIPFIENAVKNKKPFLALIWFHAPHLPIVAGPKYHEMYKKFDKDKRNYYGCVTALDEQVGRLRKKLKDLGVDKNTMVWYSSDNGPEGKDSAPGRTGGFKARKRSLHEGGVRVPGLLVWPDKIKKPFETEIPAVTTDYFPTVMDALGILKKAPHELDGISLIPLINRKMKNRSRPIGFMHGSKATFMDDRYKIYGSANKWELYDLNKDKFEENNIAADHPEKVTLLSEKFTEWTKKGKGQLRGG